jgi:transcription termination/antitermination protein NusG
MSVLHPGDRVRLIGGPLAGLEGTLVHVRNRRRFVIRLQTLQRAVSVEVDSAHVEPVR